MDRDPILEVAVEGGLVDKAVSRDGLADAIAESDLVVLCLPVLTIVETLRRYRDAFAEAGVVTDTGSTKAEVVRTAQAVGLSRFVGGHPMTGLSAGGLAHADPDLLRGATFFLCPADDVAPAVVASLRDWVAALGARPIELDPQEHDRAVALTSHLPHLVANALAEAVLEDGALEAAGGSLRDILKVAGAPFETWGDTLSTNHQAIGHALDDMVRRLTQLRQQLDNKERMRDLFARGRACRERIRPSKR
jgi:prephenate dehydrogenase